MRENTHWLHGVASEVVNLYASGYELPLPIRLANPGQVRSHPSMIWRGQIGVMPDGLLQFIKPELGIRAWAMSMGFAIRGAKARNLHEAWWAVEVAGNCVQPATDHFLARCLRVGVAETIDIDARASEICAAIIAYHYTLQTSGGSISTIYTTPTLQRGVSLSHII